jgi:hypothetical protein
MQRTAIKEWFDFYYLITGEKYIFDGKDGKHLKLLLKKIERKVSEKGMEPNEENVIQSFKLLLKSITDEWILDNLEIAIVNSKFNSIYAKAIKHSPFTKAERISEIVRAKYSPNTERAA